MIWYRLAKVVPVVNSSWGVAKVSVGEAETSFEVGSGVAHSLQYLDSEGFSVLHFGHFTGIFPLVWLKKAYQFRGYESNEIGDVPQRTTLEI